jgi:hypothetical protein
MRTSSFFSRQLRPLDVEPEECIVRRGRRLREISFGKRIKIKIYNLSADNRRPMSWGRDPIRVKRQIDGASSGALGLFCHIGNRADLSRKLSQLAGLLSESTNIRIVYDELTDAVSRSHHQFFRDHLRSWFGHLEETPRINEIVAQLESGLDFDSEAHLPRWS